MLFPDEFIGKLPDLFLSAHEEKRARIEVIGKIPRPSRTVGQVSQGDEIDAHGDFQSIATWAYTASDLRSVLSVGELKLLLKATVLTASSPRCELDAPEYCMQLGDSNRRMRQS